MVPFQKHYETEVGHFVGCHKEFPLLSRRLSLQQYEEIGRLYRISYMFLYKSKPGDWEVKADLNQFH